MPVPPASTVDIPLILSIEILLHILCQFLLLYKHVWSRKSDINAIQNAFSVEQLSKEFFDKYLDYGVDWNLIHKQGEWKTRVDKVTPNIYPIPFNKEGLEVVKKLMEITGQN